MENLPVFDSPDEYRMWKALNGKLSKNRLDTISHKVQSMPGNVHPDVLKSLMEALKAEYKIISVTTLKILVSKARPQDCSPSIKATEILISQKEITAAAEILSENRSKDMFQRHLAEARLYHGEEDRENAVTSARKGLELDPSCMELYDILMLDDPNGPWRDRKAVQLAYEGKEAQVPDDGRLRDLYAVYSNWFGGNREAATDRLINSEYYKSGDWEFILASARMSVDEKDWRSAKMMFDKIEDKAPPFVLYEAAETYIAGHDPDYALELYDKLDQMSVRSMKGRIAARIQKGVEADLMDAIREYLDSEYAGTTDHSDMAMMLLSYQDQEGAKEILDKMERSNRTDPSYLVAYSKYLLDRGDIRGAKKAAKGAASKEKNDVSVRVLAARMKFMTEDVKGAERDCDKVLSMYPDNREALLLKKDILVQRNDVKTALEVCRKILEDDPNDVTTMITLSGAMSESGDTSGSMLTLRNVLRVDPSRENMLKVIGSMIESGLDREAMFLCYDLEKEYQPDPLIRRLRGNAEYNMGEYLKASVSYAAAAELSPHDPIIWHSKGMADEARGDYESAEASYNRAVLLDLNNSEYWISKAAIQERFGDNYGAIESLNRAIELDPSSVYPMVRKAVILEKSERYSEAMYFIDMCLVTDPQNADVALLRARVLRESGHYEEALENALKVHRILPSEESALEAASCYMALDKRFDALKVLEEELKKDETSVRLRMAMDSLEEGNLLEEPKPEEEKGQTLSSEDAVAAASIADSMISLGDYKGALRAIDRAIAIDGEEIRYVCTKSSILLKTGDVNEAHSLIIDALKSNPKSAVLHESLGDIKMARADYRGALQEYEKAITLGLAIPEVIAKKGDAQQGLGYYDRSIDSYSMAVNREPTNRDLRYALAKKLFDRGYLSRADSQAVIILEKNPEDVEAIILLARIRKDSRKDAGITEAYKMFRACPDQTDEAIKEMAEVLVSAGHDEEAATLRSIETEHDSADSQPIKRSVEKVLRRAYVSRMSPDDADLLSSLGFEGEEVEQIKGYMGKIPTYGDIVPGSSDFQKMERSSNEVVLKMNWKDLESDPVLPLEKVFVTGSFKDVYDAKRLVGYVIKAMDAEVIRDDSLKVVLDKVQGTSIFEIMRACKVGVYQARQIQALLGVQ